MGIITAATLYLGAYFACVSVRYRHDVTVKEESIESAGAYYKVGSHLQNAACWFFLPASFCDAYLLRPNVWADRQATSK